MNKSEFQTRREYAQLSRKNPAQLPKKQRETKTKEEAFSVLGEDNKVNDSVPVGADEINKDIYIPSTPTARTWKTYVRNIAIAALAVTMASCGKESSESQGMEQDELEMGYVIDIAPEHLKAYDDLQRADSIYQQAMKDLKASPKDKTLLYEWENAKATFKSKKDGFNIVEESNKGIKKRIEKLYKLRIRNKTREMKKRAKDLGKEIPKTENSGIVDYN